MKEKSCIEYNNIFDDGFYNKTKLHEERWRKKRKEIPQNEIRCFAEL